jgi:hypothetical protein
MLDDFGELGPADAASCFLRLILEKLESARPALRGQIRNHAAVAVKKPSVVGVKSCGGIVGLC